MTTCTIHYLADHLDHVDCLTKWGFDQWGYLNPGQTFETRREKNLSFCTKNSCPCSFVALDPAGQPVGMASLVFDDMDEHRPLLNPWLASLFVPAEYRCHGIASRLIERVKAEAKALGYQTLYLFTPDQEAYYAKRGWNTLEKVVYMGELETIMHIPLN